MRRGRRSYSRGFAGRRTFRRGRTKSRRVSAHRSGMGRQRIGYRM